MKTPPFPSPQSGYAFIYQGSVDPRRVPSEEWDTECVTPTGREVWIGYRLIDGYRCGLWHDPEAKQFIAQRPC